MENWINVAVFCSAFIPSYVACRCFIKWLSATGGGLGAAACWLVMAIIVSATVNVGLNAYVDSGMDHQKLVSQLMSR